MQHRPIPKMAASCVFLTFYIRISLIYIFLKFKIQKNILHRKLN